MRQTEIVNVKFEPFDVKICRGTLFGNPFIIGRDGNREMVIAKFKGWFSSCLDSEVFKKELEKLKGKRLGCFCKPYPCHGDIIADYLDKNL